MVTLTGTASYNTFPSLFVCEAGHIVIGAPDLKAEYFMEVFALQPDLIP